jgi:hypothetical protein
MNKSRFLLVAFFLIIGSFIISFTQDSLTTEEPERPKEKILIAKGESGFEYNVVDIIKDHFKTKGCLVLVIDIESFAKQDFSSYKAILLLNAIKEGKLPQYIRKGMKRVDGKQKSNVFISTIAGENWLERKTRVDAVTGASNKEDAQAIADKIIARLEEMLETDPEK